MSEADAKRLAADPHVAYVQQEHRFSLADSQSTPSSQQASPLNQQTSPPWHLDRIDQRGFPLDNSYNFDSSAGAGVHVYVIDTGIRFRQNDPEFGGRVSFGADTVDHTNSADDCTGHGTHIAGTIGSNSYGVAKKVQLVAVRAFDCNEHSSDASIIDAFEFVRKQVREHAVSRAVINLSGGRVCVDDDDKPAACDVNEVRAIIDAEKAAIAEKISVVVAAGNENVDACFAPAGTAAGTINVGAIDINGAKRASSNFGFCVDIWAPGELILSVGGVRHVTGAVDPDPLLDSGTSMAAPQVTGAVALLLGTPQFASATPAQIADYLDQHATTGVITGLDNASPNKLLHIRPTTGPSIALARSGNGSLNLFGVNAGGQQFLRPQTGTSATALSWGDWAQTNTAGWSSIAAEANSGDAKAQIGAVGLTTDDTVWHRLQASPNSIQWIKWSQVGGLLSTVALARNQNNRLEMIGANRQGQLFFQMQSDPATDTWSDWQPLTAPGWMESVAADTGPNGKIDVFATDGHGKVWHAEQTAANSNTWTAFTQLPDTTNKAVDEIAVATNSDGTLNLTATDMGGGVWVTKQTTANATTWTPWSRVGTTPNTLLHVATETNADGRVAIVGVGPNGAIWQSIQTTPNATTYTPWSVIDGLLRP